MRGGGRGPNSGGGHSDKTAWLQMIRQLEGE